MPLTDAQLQGIAAQALNMAKRDMEAGAFSFLLAVYAEATGLHRMPTVEAAINQKLGVGWLNDHEDQALGFQMLRLATQERPPDAFIFVTACNVFLGTLKDALMALVQTPERVCMYHRVFDPSGLVFVGPPETTFFAQDEFDDNLKMFGAPV